MHRFAGVAWIEQGLEDGSVGHCGVGDGDSADELVALIHAGVQVVAEVRFAVLFGPARVVSISSCGYLGACRFNGNSPSWQIDDENASVAEFTFNGALSYLVKHGKQRFLFKKQLKKILTIRCGSSLQSDVSKRISFICIVP
nr:hypothetical protein [uncultured Duganella sp.]